MKVLMLGGSGYIGSSIVERLKKRGHEVCSMSIPRPDSAISHEKSAWKDTWKNVSPEMFSGYEALYFFGGESIAGYWTQKKKMRMYHSRVTLCKLLSQKITECENPPKIIITSSAVGIYGDSGDQIVDENSLPGKNFLANLAVDWEKAWEDVTLKNIPITYIRTAVVLGPDSMMLKKVLPIFRLGLGGKIGSGKQWLSWIHRDDIAELCCLPLESDEPLPVINASSQNPVTNYEFTKELGRLLKRPTIFPVPEFAVKAVFGEMGKSTVLLSCRAVSKVARDQNFDYQYSTIRDALKNSV